MILIEREISTHWYLETGIPYYEVPKADGTGTRKATLRDARKVFALPSVTNILSILDKPGLTAWKQEQAIMSALTLPMNPGEHLDEFAQRVVRDMKETSKTAQNLGSSVHAAIEGYLMHKTLPEDNKICALMEPFLQIEHKLNIRSCELVYVHSGLGYAGRIDIIGDYEGVSCVIDIKTQRFKKSKPTFYETWPMQLEAYRRAVNLTSEVQADGLLSVVLNSEIPEPAIVKLWDGQEDHWNAFQNAFGLWKYIKGYDPLNKGDQ